MRCVCVLKYYSMHDCQPVIRQVSFKFLFIVVIPYYIVRDNCCSIICQQIAHALSQQKRCFSRVDNVGANDQVKLSFTRVEVIFRHWCLAKGCRMLPPSEEPYFCVSNFV